MSFYKHAIFSACALIIGIGIYEFSEPPLSIHISHNTIQEKINERIPYQKESRAYTLTVNDMTTSFPGADNINISATFDAQIIRMDTNGQLDMTSVIDFDGRRFRLVGSNVNNFHWDFTNTNDQNEASRLGESLQDVGEHAGRLFNRFVKPKKEIDGKNIAARAIESVSDHKDQILEDMLKFTNGIAVYDVGFFYSLFIKDVQFVEGGIDITFSIAKFIFIISLIIAAMIAFLALAVYCPGTLMFFTAFGD